MPTSGLLFIFVPMVGSVGVTYWLLQRGVRGRTTTAKPDRDPTWDPVEEYPRLVPETSEFDGSSYDELVSAARETLSASSMRSRVSARKTSPT